MPAEPTQTSISPLLLVSAEELARMVPNCDRCDEHMIVTEGTAVITEGEDTPEQWCPNCREHYAFYWDSDGRYHTEEEAEDETDFSIPSYHGTEIRIEPSRLSREDVMGIELETYQEKIEDAGRFLRKLRTRTKSAIKYEHDGSLDGRYGVEIVSQPYSLKEIVNQDGSPWYEILKWSRENGGKSWDMGTGYGMHVSVNGGAMNKLHRARFIRFFNDNRELCERVAGRVQGQWARFIKSKKDVRRRNPLFGGSTPQAPANVSCELDHSDKYMACANRQKGRVEIRIFRGTLNWNRFLQNCEFVDAVRVYTKLCGIKDSGLGAISFLIWLAQPENRQHYPNLSAFLQVSRKRPEKERDTVEGGV